MTNKGTNFEIHPNNPAFPHGQYYTGGLTKREYFSSMMMQGLLASWGQHDITDFEEIASDAIRAADELIEQLNNKSIDV